MDNLVYVIAVNIGIVYLLLQTVYKYNLDIWFEGKTKFKFCVQCFVTQSAILVSLILTPALTDLSMWTIFITAISTGGWTVLLMTHK